MGGLVQSIPNTSLCDVFGFFIFISFYEQARNAASNKKAPTT
jgi:hypothetical protein